MAAVLRPFSSVMNCIPVIVDVPLFVVKKPLLNVISIPRVVNRIVGGKQVLRFAEDDNLGWICEVSTNSAPISGGRDVESENALALFRNLAIIAQRFGRQLYD